MCVCVCVCDVHFGGEKTHRVGLGHLSDLLVVLTLGQLMETIGVELPAGRVQLLPVIGSQLRSKGVDSYDEGPAISFKLHNTSKSEFQKGREKDAAEVTLRLQNQGCHTARMVPMTSAVAPPMFWQN